MDDQEGKEVTTDKGVRRWQLSAPNPTPEEGVAVKEKKSWGRLGA
jgi:hypothetical protein